MAASKRCFQFIDLLRKFCVVIQLPKRGIWVIWIRHQGVTLTVSKFFAAIWLMR